MQKKRQSQTNSNKQLPKKSIDNLCFIKIQSNQLNLQKQFSFSLGTPLSHVYKQINQFVCKNANSNNVIGYQTKNQDLLFDFCFSKKIGVLQNSFNIKPILKQSQKIGLSKYNLIKCLATGGFSKVYLARSLINGQYFAAKFIDKQKVTSQDKKILIMNQKTVNQLSNYPFLVKMHQFIQTDNFYILIMDYCPGGELFFLLRSIKRMAQDQARIYFVEILLGIQYLHKQDIMYRDLKPQNIMLDQSGHIKIADFGLAKFCRQKSYSFCGSIQYMSPQIVTNSGHSFQVDFYCLGALLFELLVGCPPFYDPDLTEYETKKNIAYCQVEFPNQIQLSQEVKDLIQKLLVKNPNKRLGHFGGAKQIMLHPWIRKVDRKLYQQKRVSIPYPPKLNKFNFDPDQIGMSEQRFTKKIKNQYELLNHEKISNKTNENKSSKAKFKKRQKQIFSRQSTASNQKLRKKSPYYRNESLDKISHQLKQNQKHQPYNFAVKTQCFRSFNIYSQTPKSLSRKSLSKSKSPCYSIDKKKGNKNILKGEMLIPYKYYSNIKTQPNVAVQKRNKKKQITEVNQQFNQIDKRYFKFKQNIPAQITLKKTSKLKLKKTKGSNFLSYGKQFRQTCIA